jgi:hypothetical protein
MTNEQLEVLFRCRDEAMIYSILAQLPECGVFAGIAQDLDWLCSQMSSEQINDQINRAQGLGGDAHVV